MKGESGRQADHEKWSFFTIYNLCDFNLLTVILSFKIVHILYCMYVIISSGKHSGMCVLFCFVL